MVADRAIALPAATFAAWLQAVHAERFTGSVLVHFGQGVANEIHVLNATTRIKLDKGSKQAHT